MTITQRICAATAVLIPVLPAIAGPGRKPPRFAASTKVVASRVADYAEQAGRREILLTRDEIAALPVHTLHDLLALLPGVGLARRGAFGTQADLNLRGSTFEQALVLVNGIRVGNSQTGHFSLDLFIPIDAIERVEVLYGPGSAAYGSGAFGGAINIVTGVETPVAHVGAGTHRLAMGGVGAPLGSGAWASGERIVHTGFRDDTESAVNMLAGGWRGRLGKGALEVAGAGGERHFGAWRFYSNRFPLEGERTSGSLLTARLGVPLGSIHFASYLRADRHLDTFVLDRSRPNWYVNHHRTDSVLAGATLSGERNRWRWTAGAEGGRDNIDSSNLGRHHRVQTAVYGELGFFGTRGTFNLQARLDHQQPWGAVTTLALGDSWRIGRGITLRAHSGQSFRAPSFTELDYCSPATVGNPNLEPERGRTTEVGLDAGPWSLTAFHRSAHPLIDFVLAGDGVWRAQNVGGLTTNGIEVALSAPTAGPLLWQRVSAVWLDSNLSLISGRSAYALAHPRLEMAWTGAARLGNTWSLGWAGRFRDPNDRGSWATLDLRLGRRILNGMKLILEADNVLDRSVSELHGIPLPGRWISVRLDWRGDR